MAQERDLKRLAQTIRRLTLMELLHAGYGHFGGSLSIVEALAALYGHAMKVDPAHPDWEDRDYFVLSKGHAAPALYATLAAVGFFPAERLETLNANGTKLPSHADRNKVEGVEMTTGSMGQGISAAAGMAYGLRVAGKSNQVYCLVGDGELNEGQCWEATQFIAHQQLTNFVLLVDDNKRQLDGPTADICQTFDLVAKFEALGLAAELVPGQDVMAIAAALDRAREAKRPTCLVLDTIKGAGVDFVANAKDNHHLRLDGAGKEAIAQAISLLEAELNLDVAAVEEGTDR